MNDYRVKIIAFTIFIPWLILSVIFSTPMATVSSSEICTTLQNGQVINSGPCVNSEGVPLFFAGLIFMIILFILSYLLIRMIPFLRPILEDEFGGEYFPLTIISLVFTIYLLFDYLTPHIFQNTELLNRLWFIRISLLAYPKLFGLHDTSFYFYILLGVVFAFATILTGIRYNKQNMKWKNSRETYERRGLIRNYSGIGISIINILVAILLISSFLQAGIGIG